MENKGIDYGLGQSNIDKETGIRYGVINQHDVGESWFDSSEAEYVYSCPYCGGDLKRGMDAKRCPACHKKIDPDLDFSDIDPSGFTVNDGEYIAEQSGDDGDIFVIKSPFYTFCQLCSPCAPGAGYLTNQINDLDPNNKAYCFGHDWFEGNKAPYRVFNVSDNQEVFPKLD